MLQKWRYSRLWIVGRRKNECKRVSLTLDGSVKIQILREQVIEYMRFPIMEKSEFSLSKEKHTDTRANKEDEEIFPLQA